ncbi:SIMPL domain-containing protein [Streptomyces boninensis]|uniref:SIMPL domain-containing protein n=1 Tax=Streptomyces boninensis TaxID=2039455 RepID=UPI003B225E48
MLLRVRGITAAAALVAATALTAATPAAAVAPDPATISVTGNGTATAKPDLAILSIGVESRGDTAKQAEEAMAKASSELLAAVRDEGVAKKDVQSQGLSLRAVYDEKSGDSKVIGYEAGQTFTVRVRDIDTTGEVVQAATDAAGDAARVNSVSFDAADHDQIEAEAREDAYRTAQAKAEQYAALSGNELGPLVSLKEGGGGSPQSIGVAAPEAADASKLEVPEGEITSDVTVSAEYRLD